MCDFTITWATTKDLENPYTDDKPIYTYSGNRTAISQLYFTLTNELNYKFVTVRDRLGKVVDMSKGVLNMPIYNNNCLLEHV